MSREEDLKEDIDKVYRALLTPSALLISATMVLSTRAPVMTFFLPAWIIGLHLLLHVFSALFWSTGVFEKENKASIRYRRRGLDILIFSFTLAPFWIIILVRAEYPYPLGIMPIVALLYFLSVRWIQSKMNQSLKRRERRN